MASIAFLRIFCYNIIMSDRLTFVTAPEVAYVYVQDSAKDRTLLHMERVVGVVAPNTQAVMEYGRRITGTEHERQLGFDPDVDARIANFYEQCLAVPPEKSPFYNCHAFAQYVLGKVVFMHRYDDCDGRSGVPVETDELMPGVLYGVMAGEQIVHSAIGTSNPSQNLGVIGNRSPLVITDNREIQNAYGDQFVQYDPVSVA